MQFACAAFAQNLGANAILTVENAKQAKARHTEKAVDAARVAVEMALLLQSMYQ